MNLWGLTPHPGYDVQKQQFSYSTPIGEVLARGIQWTSIIAASGWQHWCCGIQTSPCDHSAASQLMIPTTRSLVHLLLRLPITSPTQIVFPGGGGGLGGLSQQSDRPMWQGGHMREHVEVSATRGAPANSGSANPRGPVMPSQQQG